MLKPAEKLKLRPFQKADVMYMRKHDYKVLVANAPGTGKTIECLSCVSIDREKLCPVVIVCPASVVWNWHKEARKWTKWARIHVITDKSTPIPQEPFHIYIMSWSLLVDRAVEVVARKPQLLIADEAHYAKNIEALRSQALYAVARSVPHCLLLTGTPLINSKEELENLKNVLGSSNPPMIRRLLEDVAPDIPPKTRALLPVYLPPKIASEYRKAKDEFERWLKEILQLRMSVAQADQAARRALAAEALVKVGYLRRIVGRGKVNAAVDWAARAVRLGEPVVIFAEHSRVISQMMKQMRKQRLRYVSITGSTSKVQRQLNIEAFQSGEVPIFIGSKAASTGITLTRARHLCFVERFWTSAEEEQAEDRIRRIGQKYPTKIWFLHATGTIDDRISAIIERKRRMIHDAIGIEDIESNPEEVVLDLIASWSKHVQAPMENGNAMLGLVRALPPLPSPTETHMVIFKGKRWNKAAVKAWARMNAYHIEHIRFDGRVHRAINHPPSLFLSGSFTAFNISKEIQIIRGKRRKKVSKSKGRKKSKGLARAKMESRQLVPTRKRK
jgi:SNF2 family DNA or RNA helicase